LAMPCNTAHGYAAAIQASVEIPLLDMVALTVDRIASSGKVGSVGLLASTAVINMELFAKALAARDIRTLLPPQQDEVMALIKAVKRGDTGPQVQNRLGRVAADFAAKCDALLVACSELSVIGAGITVPFIDSLDVLAQAVVDFAAESTTGS
jgi:aspartate racemase